MVKKVTMRGVLYVVLGVISLTVQLTFSQQDNNRHDCRRALSEAEEAFYDGSMPTLTALDKLDISHGSVYNRRCKFISHHVGMNCNATEAGCLMKPTISSRKKRSDLQDGCVMEDIICPPANYYRSINGVCNNLAHPHWGMGDTTQTRLLEPVYDDGEGAMKVNGKNGPLRSARVISNIVHSTDESTELDKKHPVFVMVFGQFLAHDVALTPMSEKEIGGALDCCGSDHDSPDCYKIVIPDDDARFQNQTCMSFPRSVGRLDCDGVRQQINIHSSFVDLSMIYGTDDEMSADLREFQSGRLKMVNYSLSVDPSSSLCELDQPADPPFSYCPRSGDIRVNENPALASLHTLLNREHNRLANGLAGLNPNWSDERLFQIARQISIAQFQHIVYNEYLPAIIGQEAMQDYNIDVQPTGFKDTYDDQVDARLFNAFSTAAMRYGHTLIPHFLSIQDLHFKTKQAPVLLHEHLFRSELYHSHGKEGLEYLLMGMLGASCPARDRKVEDSVRNNLFHDFTSVAFDLIALNIQRGRDHGLQGYNAYREYCELPRANDFTTNPGGLVDHNSDDAGLLQQAYDHPDDIDLFSGMISEKSINGSLAGPTMQCLLAIQYKRLRDGDRFFYEREFEHGFTEDQLNEIKKIKMSTIMCLNMGAGKIQDNVFVRPVRDSKPSTCERELVSDYMECQNQSGVDLNLWKE